MLRCNVQRLSLRFQRRLLILGEKFERVYAFDAFVVFFIESFKCDFVFGALALVVFLLCCILYLGELVIKLLYSRRAFFMALCRIYLFFLLGENLVDLIGKLVFILLGNESEICDDILCIVRHLIHKILVPLAVNSKERIVYRFVYLLGGGE